MNEPHTTHNPFSDQPEAGQPNLHVQQPLPGGLVAICVIAMLAGGLGLLSCGWMSVGLAFPDGFQSIVPMPAQDDETMQQQQEMQSAIRSVTDRYRPIMFAVTAAIGVLSIGLLVGGFGTWQRKPLGRKILIGVFVLGMIVEVLRIIPTSLMQSETMTVVQSQIQKQMQEEREDEEKPPVPKEAVQVMEWSMKIGMMVGIVFQIGWTLVKFVLYALGIRYLTRPRTQALFAS